MAFQNTSSSSSHHPTTVTITPPTTRTLLCLSSMLLLLLLSYPTPCHSFQLQPLHSIIYPSTSTTHHSSHDFHRKPLHRKLNQHRLQYAANYYHHHHHHHLQSKSQQHRHHRQKHVQYQQRLASISAEYDDYSSSSGSSFSTSSSTRNNYEGDTSLGEKVRTVTVAYIDEIAKTQFNQDDDINDVDGAGLSSNESTTAATTTATSSSSSQNKRQRIVLDVVNGRPTFTYDIQLPIVGTIPQAIGDNTNVMATSVDLSKTVGLILNEIQMNVADTTTTTTTTTAKTRTTIDLGESALEMDTLRYLSLEEQLVKDKKFGIDCSYDEDGIDGSIQILNERKELIAGGGVIVSRIVRGGIAWKAGVRAGDRIVATSATVGDKIWPKSTLDGVRSAISSRKVMSSSIIFRLQRSCDNLISEAEVVQEFEMSLSRPMGIHIEDTPDGYVQISGFTDDAPKRVTDKLKVGDRIIAVDSSLGSKLWPISNVEGAVSAVTTRLPGQPVRLRFERAIEKGTDLSKVQSLKDTPQKSRLGQDLLSTYSKYQTSSATGTVSTANENDQLLARCRDVLKRYIYVYDPNTERSTGVPALVADRVMESLAAASAKLDPKTLSLVMNAYIVCNKPQEALRIFEATVGLAADGSCRESNQTIVGKSGGQVIQSPSGLNLYTATNLIKAHSELGDAASARRILSCIEGDQVNINGLVAKKWDAEFKADTKCYNSVLAAISNSKHVGIDVAEQVYKTMCEPVLFNTSRPKKNVVTYNTMISAYARCGRRSDAFALLNEMLDTGLKPDKYTITSLVNAVVVDGDTETALNLLSDMKKAGIKADAVGYNTVIKSLCDKSQWFEAKSLVADMEARGIKPDSKTYCLLMNGLLKLNKPGPCLTLFESACLDQTTAALMENVQLYTTAITAAATLGDYERALELVSRMTLAGVKPNIKTLTALMGACLTGGSYKYALDVYKKITKPDGYATMLGVRAHCEVGEYETAINMVDGNRLMSGKQIMSSYNYIIKSALESTNYSIAKDAMDNLLKNNFIPSKLTFKSILEPLGFLTKKKTGAFINKDASVEEEKFKYLLSIIDSIEPRKLQCTGQLYAIILTEGARKGGLFKRIASLLQKSRSNSLEVRMTLDAVEEKKKSNISSSWVNLYENYSKYRDILDEVDLPSVRVRINQKEIRQVLFAEQNVTYNAIRKRRVRRKVPAK